MSRSLSTFAVPQDQRHPRKQEVFSEQVHLLFGNSNISAIITLVAATTLALLQWGTVPARLVLGWWVYLTLITAARAALARRYRRAEPASADTSAWLTAYVVATALAGVGWGAAGILLYSETHLTNQLFMIFVLGGMMLGAGSLLAPRPEAYLAFLVPTGLFPTIRILLQADRMHLAMGLLTGTFTVATLITTSRISRTLEWSLNLQFENRDLLQELRAANERIEATNHALEVRVRERTAELSRSTEQLKAEIAHRQEMEEELLRSRKLESLGVLAGGIAHDFNNFLMVIQGNIELAKTRLKLGVPVDENLEQIATAYQRAVLLASQLLTFAKGGLPIRRLVRVADLITEAVQLARAGSAITIVVDVAEDLGFAQVDPGQIGQVLHNILMNARQAMPNGGIIEVEARRVLSSDRPETGPRVRISIRDYGCGIPADVLPLIFDPYFTTKPGGNGLGLATAHAIVTKHGGQITVESKIGEGTVFQIDLPASLEQPAPQVRATSDLHTGTARILVMDDDEAVRFLLGEVLQTLGYSVQTVRDGAEAIAVYEHAKLSGNPFGVVLLDLTVTGGMGGVETASKLKEIDTYAKLIVSSGYADAPVMSDFAAYGFDAVIAKPATPAELGAVLHRVLAENPERRQSAGQMEPRQPAEQ